MSVSEDCMRKIEELVAKWRTNENTDLEDEFSVEDDEWKIRDMEFRDVLIEVVAREYDYSSYYKFMSEHCQPCPSAKFEKQWIQKYGSM